MSTQTTWNPFTGRVDFTEAGGGPGGLPWSPVREQFEASAGQTIFPLSFTPITDSETVFINGIAQFKGVAYGYTLAGIILTISTPLKSGPGGPDQVLIKYARLTP